MWHGATCWSQKHTLEVFYIFLPTALGSARFGASAKSDLIFWPYGAKYGLSLSAFSIAAAASAPALRFLRTSARSFSIFRMELKLLILRFFFGASESLSLSDDEELLAFFFFSFFSFFDFSFSCAGAAAAGGGGAAAGGAAAGGAVGGVGAGAFPFSVSESDSMTIVATFGAGSAGVGPLPSAVLLPSFSAVSALFSPPSLFSLFSLSSPGAGSAVRH